MKSTEEYYQDQLRKDAKPLLIFKTNPIEITDEERRKFLTAYLEWEKEPKVFELVELNSSVSNIRGFKPIK